MNDREIDFLIFEYIFENEHEFIQYLKNTDEVIQCSIVEKYSTDINAAWKVVEKLRNEDYWFELVTPKSFSLDYKCYFQLDDTEVECIHETAPKAICLAALKLKGIEIE